jgi:hypothetical protein
MHVHLFPDQPMSSLTQTPLPSALSSVRWSRDLRDSDPDSHPVYNALTLLTPSRATTKWLIHMLG